MGMSSETKSRPVALRSAAARRIEERVEQRALEKSLAVCDRADFNGHQYRCKPAKSLTGETSPRFRAISAASPTSELRSVAS